MEDLLGPVHVLVRRCIAFGGKVPAAAVVFEQPLLLGARTRRGSDLRVAKNLNKLLTWPRPDRRPDLAVICVDAEGDVQARQRLEAIIAARPVVDPPACLGVAVQEFEAWLLADQAAVHGVVGAPHDQLRDLEGMRAGDAKLQLQAWLGAAFPGDHEARSRARRQIAESCDLEETGRRCPSFREFRSCLTLVTASADP